MTRGIRPLKGELIPFGPGSLKPGAVIIYLTPRIEAYLRELMRTGFYGHGVPDTCERLICRGIEREKIFPTIMTGAVLSPDLVSSCLRPQHLALPGLSFLIMSTCCRVPVRLQ